MCEKKARLPMGIGEAELLAAARQGNDEAFARLVRPCLDPAFRLALRILHDAAEAEDAVQDALYNAWRALPGFRGDARFSTWLYRIVWRQCVDRTRRRRPQPLEAPAAAAGSGDAPQARVAAQAPREELERALRRLPVRYRTVLTLFYVEDLPIKEIAAIVELPVGTVKTHLHRARRELRRLLEPAARTAGEGGAQTARQGGRP
ncbi:MAG: sigma-70 family RNA polymerase sigma factor [Tissierella sp.]|nr:sigma-70 family RNA polymerase sigma factor [Tissierella sp.]